jgi:hypothetical protein
MTEPKSKWCTPQLTVLLRSRPEEHVLLACKTPSIRGTGAGNAACKVSGTPCDINAPS